MIPIGTLCIVVERAERCIPPTISGRFCTVVPLTRGQPLMAKCNVVFPDMPGRFVVYQWSALHPVRWPRDDLREAKKDLMTLRHMGLIT